MATLQIQGNIHKEYIVSFDYKGKDVEITVNENGSHLELRVNGKQVDDCFGNAYDWQSTYGLHGAAEKQAIIGQLRQHAIYLLQNPVEVDE